MSTPLPPPYPHCGHGADPATDPVGCRGTHVPGHTVCLAHLTDTERTAYLTGLAPSADIDHRGTPFTQGLLVWCAGNCSLKSLVGFRWLAE
jgi:hypothetical protein